MNEILSGQGSFEITFLLINLIVGALLSYVLRWHYIRFGTALGNRADFSRIFVSVCLSIILIISIVQSSLALALGLVGALSIVRFRTPIKEPEELSYLFLAIALGIGLGANQLLGTSAAFLLILILLALFKGRTPETPASAYLELDLPQETSSDQAISMVSEALDPSGGAWRVTRIERDDDRSLMSFEVQTQDPRQLAALVDGLQDRFPSSRVLVLDSQHVANS